MILWSSVDQNLGIVAPVVCLVGQFSVKSHEPSVLRSPRWLKLLVPLPVAARNGDGAAAASDGAGHANAAASDGAADGASAASWTRTGRCWSATCPGAALISFVSFVQSSEDRSEHDPDPFGDNKALQTLDAMPSMMELRTNLQTCCSLSLFECIC